MTLGLATIIGGAVHFRLALVDLGLREGLAGLGFEGARFSVARVDLTGARIEKIRLGPDLAADAVSLAYSPSGLARRNLAGVEIAGLRLDLSRPGAGALNILREKLAGGDENSTPAPAVPPIRLSGAQLVAALPGGRITARLEGAVKPNLSAQFEASLQASARLAEGHRLEIKAPLAKVDLDAGAKSAKITLPQGLIKDAGDGPGFFSPLSFSASGDFDGQQINFSIAARDRSRKLHLIARGGAEPAKETVEVTLSFPAIGFRRGGMQPADLIPLAAFGIPVEGSLAGRARLDWRAGALSAHAEFRAEDVAADFGDLTLGGASARLSIGLGDDRARPRLRIDAGRALLGRGAESFRLSALEGFVTLGDQPGQMDFELRGARLAHRAERPWFTPLALSGGGSLLDEKLSLRARVSGAGGQARIDITGSHQLSGGEGGLEARLGKLSFTPGGLQPAGLVPSLAALEDVSGGLGGRLRLSWGDGAPDGMAALSLDDLSFKLGQARIEGLTGRLGLDRLNPPTAQTTQKLRARRVLSLLALEDARLAFRLLPGEDGRAARFLIDRAEGGLAGGRLIIEQAVIDGAATDGRLDLRLERVDLASLLALLDLDGVAASGRLSGTLPLRMAGDRVWVDGGGLAAEGPGILRFRSAAAKRALAGGGAEAALLLRVLEDFRYKKLSLKIDNAPDGQTVIRLGTEGHNPAVRDGYPFILNINLSGNLERVAGAALEVYRLSGQALRATLGGAR